MATSIASEFTETYQDCPAKWFTSLASAAEYTDYLLRNQISFKTEIVRPKKQRYQVVIMYMGVTRHQGVHCIPSFDLRDHSSSPYCWCNPKRDADESTIWVHNALDHRELYENGDLELH